MSSAAELPSFLAHFLQVVCEIPRTLTDVLESFLQSVWSAMALGFRCAILGIMT